MRRNPHSDSKLTARQHLIRARRERVYNYYLTNDKPYKRGDDPYFLPADYIEAFGWRGKTGVPAKTEKNGYPAN